MVNTRTSTITGILIVLFFLIPLHDNYVNAGETGEVIVNGKVVMRFYSREGEDPQKKSEIIQQRIEDKAGSPVKDIQVKNIKGEISIFWGDSLICTVDKYQAAMNKSTPQALAGRWRLNLVAALGDKPLKFSQKTLSIPVGESKSISYSGGGKGEISLTYDAQSLDIQLDEANNVITVSAGTAGSFKVVLQKGSSKGVIRVYAKEWAGRIGSNIEKVVTGNPTPPEIQIEAALTAVNEGVELQPGSQVFLKEYPRITTSLKPGYEQLVKIPLTLKGKGYFPVEGTLIVKIKNKEIPLKDPEVLMISNRPESLDVEGILFKGTFSKGQSVRLLYSHKNISPKKRRLWITVKNTSRTPLKLFTLKAYAGPDKFEIHAGHMAAMRYLEYLRRGSGFVIDIPPRRAYVLEEFTMAPQFTLSGLCDFQIIEGEEVEIEVKTVEEKGKSHGLEIISRPFDPFKIHPHGIFPSPLITIEKNYSVQDEDLSVEVGKWPWLIDAQSGEPNTGNYGVLYKIRVNLVNDTRRQEKVDVSFMPRNGVSMGSILINGTLLETGVVRLEESAHLTTLSLSPGEERVMEIITLPEAGSCYPINIKLSTSKEKEAAEQ